MNAPALVQPATPPAEGRTIALSPMELLSAAVERGASVETIERLAALAERMDQARARRAFDEAISAAKAEIPAIRKNRAVDFTTLKGRTNYVYEDMAEIAATVDPILSKHGLSYRYRTTVDQGLITVTCVLSHRDGHSEENSLSAGRDESGNKNNIQAVGSTQTYLQRYTLKAALGLAAAKDDDGRASAATNDPARISEAQWEELRRKLEEAGIGADEFCGVGDIEALPELRADKFAEAIRWIERAGKTRKDRAGGAS